MGCNFQNTLFINRKSDDSFTITGCCLTEQIDISYEDFFEKDITLLGDLRKGLKQIKGTTCLHQPCDYQEIKNVSINVLDYDFNLLSSYSLISDNIGQIHIPVSLSEGVYVVSYDFKGDDKYV